MSEVILEDMDAFPSTSIVRTSLRTNVCIKIYGTFAPFLPGFNEILQATYLKKLVQRKAYKSWRLSTCLDQQIKMRARVLQPHAENNSSGHKLWHPRSEVVQELLRDAGNIRELRYLIRFPLDLFLTIFRRIPELPLLGMAPQRIRGRVIELSLGGGINSILKSVGSKRSRGSEEDEEGDGASDHTHLHAARLTWRQVNFCTSNLSKVTVASWSASPALIWEAWRRCC